MTHLPATHRRAFVKNDGRNLYLYGRRPHDGAQLPEAAVTPHETTHLRWHPLREEWVVYAPGRAKREVPPSGDTCVLCPSLPGDYPSEIPFEDFEVAVFDNRYASFRGDAPDPPRLSVPTARAVGTCEVVVYSARHDGTIADLDLDQRELVVDVWTDRYVQLGQRDDVRFVYPFENRGPGIGASLTHPHGQIYALPYLPLIIEQEADAFRREPVLEKLLSSIEPMYVIVEDEYHVTLVPPFARYPYEVWIVPRRFVPGPWAYTEPERRSFAWMLGDVIERYDALVDGLLPFMMVFHAAPKGEESSYHFHAEFYPPHRPEQQVRPHVGVEFGLWVHLLEAPLDVAADRLRNAK